MRNPVEIAKNLGKLRAQELIDAYTAHQAAKATIEELQRDLASHRQRQAELAPEALIAANVGVAALATGQAQTTAHGTMINHLTNERIPAAQRALSITGQALNKIVEAIARKEAYVSEQRAIIDKAQAELERAQSWLDA